MSKAVMISIQPYYVFLIIAQKMGWDIPQEKRIEVRKDFPKDPAWNKLVYIYCSQNRKSFKRIPKEYQPLMKKFLGKVVSHFRCGGMMQPSSSLNLMVKASCISEDELLKYANYSKQLYGWRICDLIIYDKPKELGDFISHCSNRKTYLSDLETCRIGCKHNKAKTDKRGWLFYRCDRRLTYPPQSWCYVEGEE